MTRHENETREKIMVTTIELIQKYGDTTKITIREIADKTGVGVGLVNYHFQTKENLINQCVQRLISQVINQFEPLSKSLEMKPLDKLRYLAKSTAAFIATNPGISRISILNDLILPKTGDNSTQTAHVYFPVFKEVCGGQNTDQELFVLLHLLISSVQVAFLRKDAIKETMGIDFSNTQQREAFIDMVINRIFSDISS